MRKLMLVVVAALVVVGMTVPSIAMAGKGDGASQGQGSGASQSESAGQQSGADQAPAPQGESGGTGEPQAGPNESPKGPAEEPGGPSDDAPAPGAGQAQNSNRRQGAADDPEQEWERMRVKAQTKRFERARLRSMEASGSMIASGAPEPGEDPAGTGQGRETALTHLQENLARAEARVEEGTLSQLPPGLVDAIERFTAWLGIGTVDPTDA